MEVDTSPPAPSPKKKSPTPSPRKPPSSVGSSSSSSSTSVSKGGGAVGEVSDRLDLYRRAVQQAESAGEGSKVRRYKRSLATLEQVMSFEQELS